MLLLLHELTIQDGKTQGQWLSVAGKERGEPAMNDSSFAAQNVSQQQEQRWRR
jgi:hypothetical protein